MFVITIDNDWASDEIIQDTVNLLKERNLQSTIFITNKIDFSKLSNHELAIHPNFENTESEEITLKKIISLLPNQKTRGSRSHKLINSSTIFQLYNKFGIEYDSNYYIPSSKHAEPFMIDWANILEIPFFFADDAYFETKNKFDLSDIDTLDNGVKVFLFHPFHIFMNTTSVEDYIKHKNNYQDINYLQKNRINDKKGTRTLFISLLDYIEKNNIETKTMSDVNFIYRNKLKND